MAQIDLAFIQELYQAKGIDLSVCTYWSGVAQGTYQAGPYSHNGAFALVQGSKIEPMMLIASNLQSEVAPPLNSILQHYFQFRAWNGINTQYMDFTCNTLVGNNTVTITKQGSCGSNILANITTGLYSTVKGTQAPDASLCNTDAVLSTSKLGLPFNVTDIYKVSLNKSMNSVCTFVRPLQAPGLSSLKVSSSVTFLSGFNVFSNANSTTRVAFGESNLRSFVVVNSGTSLLWTAGLAVVATLF